MRYIPALLHLGTLDSPSALQGGKGRVILNSKLTKKKHKMQKMLH